MALRQSILVFGTPNQNIFGEYAGHGFQGFPEYLPDRVYTSTS